MKIWVNTIVHNEENFVWFALMSIVDYVDKILVWDSGSTDKTVDVIQEVIKEKGQKVEFREVDSADEHEFTKVRQSMLNQSKCDWILILDGDEVWWKDSIKQVIDLIKKRGDTIDAIISPFFNMVGDIYHYQSEDAGKYEIAGKKGHLTIRAINRKIPGLHLSGPYGKEGYTDSEGKFIQQRDASRLVSLDAPFMHLTHLKRSEKDNHNKYKYDLGLKLNKDLPEVFFMKRPDIVPLPCEERSKLYEALSLGKKILKHE